MVNCTRTDTDTEREQPEACHCVLEEIRPTRTEQGSSGAVVLAVVRGIEAVRASQSMSVRSRYRNIVVKKRPTRGMRYPTYTPDGIFDADHSQTSATDLRDSNSGRQDPDEGR